MCYVISLGAVSDLLVNQHAILGLSVVGLVYQGSTISQPCDFVLNFFTLNVGNKQ